MDCALFAGIGQAERDKRLKGWEKAVKYAFGWAKDE